MAGRLVIGRLPGLVLDAEHKQALQAGTLGGITLFKENARDLKQLANLTNDILNASFHAPVLTVDQEGGAVQRFDHVLSPLPSPMALAAGNDKEQTRAITEISCRQLKALGFNLLLAPTLDLLTNPLNPVIGTRAFSSDLELSARMGAQVISVIENSGLIACPKHFPGHGSTSQDSHLELAIVNKSRPQLVEYDLAPFAKNIASMRTILIGHIWLPQLEEKKPATLSPLVVTEILRNELNFDGLAISDDMTMKAITRAYGLGEACVMAVEAGVDLILVCGTFAESLQAVQAIAAAMESGRLSDKRVSQAMARLNKLFQGKPESLNPATEPQGLELLQKQIETDTLISTRFSATAPALLQGNLSQADNWLVLAPEHARYKLPLANYLSDHLPGVQGLRYSMNLDETEIENLAGQCASRNVVLVTFRSFINSAQARLAEQIGNNMDKEHQFIHVAADTPYDLLKMPASITASLAAFDPSDQAMAGIAEIIAGKSKARGVCPVNLQLDLAAISHIIE